ncbi:MAG: DUF4258 domain-containing protein [Myxococcota bacterium]|jgi:hypothetical protein|nr:DUF4258 domain-containing protein [Myxococcota bacterium]
MNRKLFIRMHAARRMLERTISIDEVAFVIETGEMIEDYPDDEPFPSRRLLGWPKNRPLHVVAADETNSDITHVITAYQPDPDQWDDTFKRREK